MTLPHVTGLARESALRPDSVVAAEAHARGRTRWWPGRIEWTWRNVIPLVALVTLGVGGLVALGVRVVTSVPPPYSTDTTTPRGAVGAYFQALARDDIDTAVALLCESEKQHLLRIGFVDVTAEAVRHAPIEARPVSIWEAEPRGGDWYVVGVANREGSGDILVVEEHAGQYRVCGLV